MPVSVGARSTFVIAATVVSVALASGLGAWSVQHSPAAGPCQMLFGGRTYCTETLTTRGWCPSGTPCPYMGNSTVLLGYTFNVQPLLAENGTPGLEVGAYGPGEPGTGHLLLSNSFGTEVMWTSTDGLLLVIWTNAPPSWQTPPPEAANALCGVAES
jgi:hypothetical protein